MLANPKISGIVNALAGDVQDLVKGEIALARSELDAKLHRIIMAAVWLLGGALVAFAGLVVILEGAAAGLAFVLPAWASLLIVGGVIIAIGALFAKSGLNRLAFKALAPTRTTASLNKDVQLVKEHVS